MGAHPYASVSGAADSSASLGMDFVQSGPHPSDSASYVAGTSRQSSLMMGTDALQLGDSEGAALTSHPAPSGFSRFGQMVQSPEEHQSPPLPRSADYFDGIRVDSPSNLEEAPATAGTDVPMQRSSADMYASMGISVEGKGVERARQGLTRMAKSIRRVSRRVVNLDDSQRPPTQGRIRLPDNEDETGSSDGGDAIAVEELPSEPALSGLRGKSLGMLGPDNPLRRTLASLMTQWWIEPVILAMILFNVILLIIQSAPNVFDHPRKKGYFDYWVDFALLSVFVVYTMEMVARIIVSGFVINPPAAYESPRHQAEAEAEGEAEPIETPITQHMRAKTSRSNTLDTFAIFSDSVKLRAAEAIRPHNHLGHLQRGAPVSPNRSHAPRRVTSAVLQPDGDTPTAMRTAQSGRQGSSATTGLWEDKTSKFLQKTRLAPFAEAILKQRAQAVDYAYLRHSWNRVDFIAVISFWVTFALSVANQEMTPAHHIYVFRALSVLRCARLLTVTRGTSVILRSLKTAGPLLVNVAFFTIFTMLLFGIIGVQSFEGNYRRSCVWIGDLQSDQNAPAGQNYTLSQMCGGFLDSVTGKRRAAIREDGSPLPVGVKGYVCPQGQICLEAEKNPEGNSESFDNIFSALLQVIIVISSNGWSTIMYDMMDADYYASCLYFIIGLIIMNFWMANLFVAVITNTFATISAETKQSAFAAERIEPVRPTEQDESAATQRRRRVANVFKRFWGYTKWFWLALIVADLGVQASQASYHRSAANDRLSTAELYLTIAFDVEIVMRFFSYLLDNDWRGFLVNKRNRFDLFLAVITTVIQAPPIKHSPVFPWLTVFQLARFYRVIAAVPRMEALLVRVFGSLSGLFNMILFLLLIVGLASLLAAQLFRGDLPQEDDGETIEINFKHMWNSFLGMYQIFSSENWTTPLYNVLSIEGEFKQAVIGGIFLSGWFLFANFIVLQMFIAVIAENFGVAESQKRAQQLELYLRNLEKPKTALIVRMLQQLSPYRWLRDYNAAMMGESVKDEHPNTRLGAQRALDAIDEKNRNRRSLRAIVTPSKAHKVIKIVRRFLRLDRPDEQMPLDTIRARQIRQSFSGASMLSDRRQYSMYETASTVAATAAAASANSSPNLGRQPEDVARLFARDRQLRRMRSDLGLISEESPNQAEVDALHANRWKDDPRMVQARLINTHPSYEKSLWLFSNTSSFRRTCQSIVPCSHGERLFGRKTSSFRQKIYQLAILAAIAASVVVAGVATPHYRRDWYKTHGFRRDSWFSLTEVTLSVIFIAEFFVKVIADGFAFTPNAYLMSPWNALDLFVLLTLIVNVITELAVIGGVSRFTRALKAFRALRLINLSDLMRRTFSGLIAVGGRFVDASVLAILYIVPFAIWGQNLFSGLLYSCTDGSSGISNKADCIGEYGASPSQWTFLAPRVWQNPTEGSVYSFDDFRSSLLILFEIVSLEGWTNVMATAMSVVGFNQQLQTDSRQINALFFVIYNLIGAVFVLTLFVAVIIESFQSFSGAAYQTTAQRQWIDLKRLISRQRPSKRPKVRPTDKVRAWCYDRAVHKHGWWSRSMTVLYLVSLITLATQQYGDRAGYEQSRDIIYISLAAVFAIDIIVRLIGVGWRAYRQDMWNIFDLVVVTGTLATSIPLLSPSPNNSANVQLQKFFLVAVAFKLVQKNNALNQLFKTAVSSLPSIASLFLLWLTMFLVWGIMLVEVFGLTAWGVNETYNKNFTTLLGSLVFLAMMSTGEGWNSYMHDFTLSSPYCTPSSNYLNTDCGSEGWAYFLFVGWNVISMYIFLNMFTATVVENFSYVFQLGGKPTLSREQVRNFKKAWAEFDLNRSGYLPKEKFVAFFNRLEGTLQVRVYPPEASIKALKEKAMASKPGRPRSLDASSRGSRSPTRGPAGKLRLRSPIGGAGSGKDDQKGHFMWPPSPSEIVVDGINIASLKRQLSKLDHTEIRRRKHRFERLYYEACLLHDQPQNRNKGGLSFTGMLMLLAHYKLIDDEQALSLEELVERREMLQRVEDRLETDRVRSILRRIWLRRRFLAIMEAREGLGLANTDHNTPQSMSRAPAGSSSVVLPAIHIDSSDGPVNRDRDGLTQPSLLTQRSKPALHLDLTNLSSHKAADDEETSLGRTHVLSKGDRAADQPSIHVTSTDDDDDDDEMVMAYSAETSPLSRSRDISDTPFPLQISPSPSLQELERRASPIIQEIDTSAWGTVARRLSADAASTGLATTTTRGSSENGSMLAPEQASSSTASRHNPSNSMAKFNPFRSRRTEQEREGAAAAASSVSPTSEMREVPASDQSSTASMGRPGSSQQHHQAAQDHQRAWL